MQNILTDPVYLRRYEADASAVWADIEFLATYFKEEYPAPDADAVPADVLSDVEFMAPVLAGLRKLVERRLDRNTAAKVAAKVESGKAVAP